MTFTSCVGLPEGMVKHIHFIRSQEPHRHGYTGIPSGNQPWQGNPLWMGKQFQQAKPTIYHQRVTLVAPHKVEPYQNGEFGNMNELLQTILTQWSIIAWFKGNPPDTMDLPAENWDFRNFPLLYPTSGTWARVCTPHTHTHLRTKIYILSCNRFWLWETSCHPIPNPR